MALFYEMCRIKKKFLRGLYASLSDNRKVLLLE